MIKLLGNLDIEKKGRLFIITFISSVAVVLAIWKTPQGLYYDPAWQLKGLQQYLNGKSPSINHLVEPRVDDLSQDKAGWIVCWPPGTQILAYPLMANGVTLGDTIRVIATICLVIGSLGWVRWFSLFSFPKWIKIVLAIAIPWMRYPSNALFLYSAEILVYASAPLILIATYNLGRAWENRKYRPGMIFVSAALGLGLGVVYWLKYTAVFVSLGALLYLGLVFYRVLKVKNKFSYRATIIVSFILIVILFITPVVTHNLLNYKLRGLLNPFDCKRGLHFSGEDFFFLLAYPPLAMTDADSLWRYVLLHPDHGLFRNIPLKDLGSGDSSLWLGFLGLPGGLLLLWLLRFPLISKSIRELSLSVFFISLLVMLCIWIVAHTGIGYQARYLAAASITILPLVIEVGFNLWNSHRKRILKLFLACAAIFYIIIPLLYGGFSVVGKVIRTPADYRVGPSRIYNHLLATNDLAGVRKRLLRNFSIDKDIWYLPEPISALDLPGRAIIRDAVFVPKFILEKEKFLSATSLQVYALLPPFFEKNSRGPLIRKSFVQADRWKKTEIEGCKYTLWTTTLNVHVKLNKNSTGKE